MGEYIEQSWGWDEQAHRAIFDEQIAGDSLKVIEVGGNRAGLLRVDEHSTEMRLEIMELDPDHQGKGIGGEILSGLLERAETLGNPLTLFALTSDTRAIDFYQRHGLTVVRREPHRVFMSSP
jgi:GNAT superfamily N-acetyltransferase